MEFLRYIVCSLSLVFLMMIKVKGQNETVDVIDSPTTIYSPGYADGAYGANISYDYIASTNLTNHTLIVKFTDCELEGEERKGKIVCFDYVTVYDGSSSSATKLGEYCCLPATLPTYETTGDTVYIIFTSDGSSEFKGFSLTIGADGGPTTTSTTTSTTSTTTTITTDVSSVITQASAESSKNYTWIIVGSVVGGVNLIIIIVIILVCFVKKTGNSSVPGSASITNRKSWSRSNTMVEPSTTKEAIPEEGAQTNIFNMDLPAADGKANQLPPLKKCLTPGPKENSFVLG